MTRLLFPDSADRLVYTSVGVAGAATMTATVYTAESGGSLANLLTCVDDGTGAYSQGVAITGSTLTVNSDSQLPLFYGPDDSTDTLWVTVNGGNRYEVKARTDERLDRLTALASYVINVKDSAYGALGDGTTNDSAAFTLVNSAVATAIAARGGAKVVMPAGHYKSTVGLAALTDLTVEGDSMGGTIFEITSATASAISGADKRRVTVRDLELRGPGSGSGLGLNLTYSSSAPFNCSFENVYIKSFGGEGFHAETLCASIMRNVRVENCGGKGIYIDNGTSVVMDAVYANTNGAEGVHLKTMSYCTINGGAADANTIAYHIQGGGNITVNGSGSEGSAVGFKINGGTSFVLNNPYVRAETSAAYWVTGSATGVILNVPREVSPDSAATASIQVDAGCRVQVNLPQVVTAVSYATGTTGWYTATGAYYTSAGNMIVTANRAATSNFAGFTVASAESDQWGIQVRPLDVSTNPGANDLHVRNLVNGLTGLLVEMRATAPNLSLLTSTKSYGGGVGVVYVPNASSDPSTNPTGGGVLYASGGALKWRGSSGTVTTIAAA